MNYNLLKSKIIEKGLTQQKLAEKLGISRSALSLKMNGKTCFTNKEEKEIISLLGLSYEQIFSIFFAN